MFELPRPDEGETSLTSDIELFDTLSTNINSITLRHFKPLTEMILRQLRLSPGYSTAQTLSWEDDSLQILNLQGLRSPRLIKPLLERLLPRASYDSIFERDNPVAIGDVWTKDALQTVLSPIFQTQSENLYELLRSWMGVPLVVDGRRLGIISLFGEQPDFYGTRRAKLAANIVNQAVKAHLRLSQRSQKLAISEERSRIGRDLHDSVMQVLYSVQLGINTARVLLDHHEQERVRSQLNDLLLLVEGGMTEMRTLIFELRPESLETEGLITALYKQAEVVRARYGLEVEAILSAEPDISIDKKEALYRIAQQALNNTVKHAKASRVKLKLQLTNRILLEVCDNGTGFDPAAARPGHIGLLSMHERATEQGGRLEIISDADGTCVQAILPLH